MKLTIGTEQHFRWLKTIVAFILILNVIDGVLTIVWVFSDMAVEANPLMAKLLAVHPVLFISVKMALVFLGSYLLWRFRTRPFAVVGIFLVFLVYYFLLLYHLNALNIGLVDTFWG